MPLHVPPPGLAAARAAEAETLPGTESPAPAPPGQVERRPEPRTGLPPSRPRKAKPGPPSAPQPEVEAASTPSPSQRRETGPEAPPGQLDLPAVTGRDLESPPVPPPLTTGEHVTVPRQARRAQEPGPGHAKKVPGLSAAEGPAIQRQREGQPASADTPPAEPAAPLLGREVRAQAAARARMPLAAPRLQPRRVQIEGEAAAGLSPPSRGLLRPAARTPGLYHRTPDRHVGPDPSLAVLSQAARRAAPRRGPAAPARGTAEPGGSATSLEALLAAWDVGAEETMVLPPPPQMAAPASRPASQAGPSRTFRPAPGQTRQLPLPPAPAPAQRVQRQVAAPAITPLAEASPAPAGIVQRAEGEGVGGRDIGVDIDEGDLRDLAQRVLPIVKRMLAIERERRPGW